ncbi:hypothetical protein TNCV_5065111 [Trichonephila clavipes]|nr:hypothetical protein TNCV_5065111 [Trichonephila clavipes]
MDLLKLVIDQKRPQLANRRDVVFHQDNARPHTSVSDSSGTLEAWLLNFNLRRLLTSFEDYWDGPLNLKPRSNDKDDIGVGTTVFKFLFPTNEKALNIDTFNAHQHLNTASHLSTEECKWLIKDMWGLALSRETITLKIVMEYLLDQYVALTFSKYSQWTAMAGSDVVQSGRPIFDDFFQHLWPYIGNNTANVVFQMVKRLWHIRIDQ